MGGEINFDSARKRGSPSLPSPFPFALFPLPLFLPFSSHRRRRCRHVLLALGKQRKKRHRPHPSSRPHIAKVRPVLPGSSFFPNSTDPISSSYRKSFLVVQFTLSNFRPHLDPAPAPRRPPPLLPFVCQRSGRGTAGEGGSKADSPSPPSSSFSPRPSWALSLSSLSFYRYTRAEGGGMK